MKNIAADFPLGTKVRLCKSHLSVSAFTIPKGTDGEVTCNDEHGIIVRFQLGSRTWSADVEPQEIEAKGGGA